MKRLLIVLTIFLATTVQSAEVARMGLLGIPEFLQGIWQEGHYSKDKGKTIIKAAYHPVYRVQATKISFGKEVLTVRSVYRVKEGEQTFVIIELNGSSLVMIVKITTQQPFLVQFMNAKGNEVSRAMYRIVQ